MIWQVDRVHIHTYRRRMEMIVSRIKGTFQYFSGAPFFREDHGEKTRISGGIDEAQTSIRVTSYWRSVLLRRQVCIEDRTRLSKYISPCYTRVPHQGQACPIGIMTYLFG